MNAGEIGEDGLIRRLVLQAPHPARPGYAPGDDCALVDGGGDELLLFKADALVEGVHYESGESGHRVGWKALARVVSDFAAMGGWPTEFLVTIVLPACTSVEWLEHVYQGMGACMSRYGGVLAGGETSSAPNGSPIVISVSGLGRVERGGEILRSGGRCGDLLVVTGRLGGSLAGKHLDFEPRLAEARWLAKSRHVSAMMDVSDGLAKDLPRLASASGCGFRVDRASIPRAPGCSVEQALGDGEDFELLFAVPRDNWPTLSQGWRECFPGLDLTVIGELVACDAGDRLVGGWDHFSA